MRLLGMAPPMSGKSRAVTEEEINLSRAVRGALSKIPGSVVEEFVRRRRDASVFDFCEAQLAGLYPKASGGTKLAYLTIQNRLSRARRKLGIVRSGGRHSSTPTDQLAH